MHPSKFFAEVKILDRDIRIVSANEDVANMLKNVHPMNWIGSDVKFQIVKITVSYDTSKGNWKTAEKYSIQNLDMDSYDCPEMQAEIQAQSDIEKFLLLHPHTKMKNYKVENVEIMALAALRIE